VVSPILCFRALAALIFQACIESVWQVRIKAALVSGGIKSAFIDGGALFALVHWFALLHW
jgi:hypothetical protein